MQRVRRWADWVWVAVMCGGAGAISGASGCTSTVRDFGNGGSASNGGSGGTPTTSTTSGGSGGTTTASTSTSSSSGSTSSSSSSGSTSSSSGSTSSSSSSGSGGQPCVPGDPPYAGPLCGPAGGPCVVLADEIVDPPNGRLTAPAVAIDPACGAHVLFSDNIGAFHGYYADRVGPGTWQSGQTPFPCTDGGLVIDPDGTAFVLCEGGAFDLQFWRYAQGQWGTDVAVPAPGISNVNSLARDKDGTLHASFFTSSYDLAYAQKSATGWAVSTYEHSDVRNVIDVSPEGYPHIAYWGTNTSGWILKWISPGAAPAEIATPLGSNFLDTPSQLHRLAVTPVDAANPMGRPHLLYARPLPNIPSKYEIAYATRGSGGWKVSGIDAPDLATSVECTGQPFQGQMCNFDYEALLPLAAVASRGGDVRLLYAKNRYMGTMVGFCQGPGPGMCWWQMQTDNSTGSIFVAWVDANANAQTAQVATGVIPRGGSAALDNGGNIHLAFYDGSPWASGAAVRYVAIGF